MIFLKHVWTVRFSGDSQNLRSMQSEYPVQENSVQMDPVLLDLQDLEMSLVKEVEKTCTQIGAGLL